MPPSQEPESQREIVQARRFQAPRELVFEAFTAERHLAHWWGPKGFHVTTESADIRPGGLWLFTMHGPDGTDYPNRIEYVELARPERIVYIHGTPGELGYFRTTVTFEEQAGETQLTMRAVFPTAAERDEVVRKYNAIEGGRQTLERLAFYLTSNLEAIQNETGDFILIRVFDAPRELVFKAWTEADRLAQWWGPKGFSWVACKLDLRPGGLFHYAMRTPDGAHTMWGKFVFREVAPPERLAFVVSFSDEQGGTTRHPMSATWPLEVLNTITFTQIDGKTTVVLRGAPINATEEERATFDAGRGSMQQGFKGTMDNLAEYLAGAK